MAEHQRRELKTGGTSPVRVLSSALALAAGVGLLASLPARALSEFKPAEAQTTEDAPETEAPPLEGPLTGPDGGLPEPGPVIRQTPVAQPDAEAAPANTGDDIVSIEIVTDLTQLPAPVLRMRELILEAAATGDPERLRAVLGTGERATRLALGEIDSDPVEYIRATSGDGEGLEILAILIDLLHAGVVRVDAGEPGETYIWPYFAALPLENLTPPQQVELLRIVTAGDVEDMRAYGGYNFYRVGISPDGEWRFFMAGD